MKISRRLSSWFRSLFHSDDIPLLVLLPDGRRLYDKHPLVRHGVVVSRKHNIVLPYAPPIPAYKLKDPDAPPVCVGQEYVYTADGGLDPITKIEAMYGFFQDGEFGIDHKKLAGPAWRRRIRLSTIIRRVCLIASVALFLYVYSMNDFEGFRRLAVWATELATWATGRAAGVYIPLSENPHWLIVAVVSALLSVLLAGLAKLAWSRLRRLGRRKPRWWEPPSD